MNNQQLWQSVLGNMEVSLSRGNFTTWFKNTAVVDRSDDAITIGVPSEFIRKWISEKFQSEILKVLKQIAPEIREIKYQVGQKAAAEPAAQTAAASKTETPEATPYREQQEARAFDGLNPRYTFETFVTGKNNELANAASVAVSNNPGTQYNPLFIYGGVGLGKTHLMHAVGHQFLRKNRGGKVLYVTSEKFTNDYVSGLQTKQMPEFKKRYRTVDMLLVDDIQFISGKETTQEEFFHTFNELRDRGKQIVLTSDRPPKDITGIEQRLISRFEWGMVADIQVPDLETRLAILNAKVAKKNVRIDDEVLSYIAENITNNIRELEGALNRLIVQEQMENKPMTLENAKGILANMLSAKKKVLSLKKISMSVAEFYNISMEDLLKQSRRKEYVKPRQVAMYLARKEMGSSFPAIGEFFGGRDHTTVMHGVEKIENIAAANEVLKQELDLILDKLYVN